MAAATWITMRTPPQPPLTLAQRFAQQRQQQTAQLQLLEEYQRRKAAKILFQRQPQQKSPAAPGLAWLEDESAAATHTAIPPRKGFHLQLYWRTLEVTPWPQPPELGSPPSRRCDRAAALTPRRLPPALAARPGSPDPDAADAADACARPTPPCTPCRPSTQSSMRPSPRRAAPSTPASSRPDSASRASASPRERVPLSPAIAAERAAFAQARQRKLSVARAPRLDITARCEDRCEERGVVSPRGDGFSPRCPPQHRKAPCLVR